MTEPEYRPTPPSSPKPADAPGASLSPRLREKLMEAEEKAAGGGGGGGSPVVGLVLAVVVIAAIVGVVWWMIKADQSKKAAEAGRAAAAARAIAVADSLDAVARADSIAAAARADSVAFAALPKSQQRKILAERAKKAAEAAGGTTITARPAAGATSASGASTGATAAKPADSTAAAEPAAPKEKGPFAIDAGEYLDQAKANEVAETLKTKAKLAAQVVSVGEGGSALYHVFLGSFATRSAAEKSAGALFEKGIVEQAGVVPIPAAP